jgi:hypothetical protein
MARSKSKETIAQRKKRLAEAAKKRKATEPDDASEEENSGEEGDDNDAPDSNDVYEPNEEDEEDGEEVDKQEFQNRVAKRIDAALEKSAQKIVRRRERENNADNSSSSSESTIADEETTVNHNPRSTQDIVASRFRNRAKTAPLVVQVLRAKEPLQPVCQVGLIPTTRKEWRMRVWWVKSRIKSHGWQTWCPPRCSERSSSFAVTITSIYAAKLQPCSFKKWRFIRMTPSCGGNK